MPHFKGTLRNQHDEKFLAKKEATNVTPKTFVASLQWRLNMDGDKSTRPDFAGNVDTHIMSI